MACRKTSWSAHRARTRPATALRGQPHTQWDRSRTCQTNVSARASAEVGLTALGKHMVKEMMRLGMIVNPDHASQASVDEMFS